MRIIVSELSKVQHSPQDLELLIVPLTSWLLLLQRHRLSRKQLNPPQLSLNHIATLMGKSDENLAAGFEVRGYETPVTVSPTAIPPYATPCSGSVRYSSACSCIGVTAATTTAPTPVKTTTTTKIITETAKPPYIHPAPYCWDECYDGYKPNCGHSYIDVSKGWYVPNIKSYEDCAKSCSHEKGCYGFSFVLTSKCCWITGDKYIVEGRPPLADPVVNSGRVCHKK